MSGPYVVLLVMASTLGTAGLWMGVMWLVGRKSGWTALARAYPSMRPPAGQMFRFQSMTLRSSRFASAVTFVVGEDGLEARLGVMSRWGNPAWHIPWTLIEERAVWTDETEVSVATPDGPLGMTIPTPVWVARPGARQAR